MIWKLTFDDDICINLSDIQDVFELVSFFARCAVKFGNPINIQIKGEVQ